MYLYEARPWLDAQSASCSKTFIFQTFQQIHRYCSIGTSVKRNTGSRVRKTNPFLRVSTGPLRTSGYPQCATRERCTNKGGWTDMPIVQRVTRISYIDELLAPHDNDFERATTTILHSTRATSCVLKKDIFFRIINRRSIGKFRDVILSEDDQHARTFLLPSVPPLPVLGKNRTVSRLIATIAAMRLTRIYAHTRARPRTATREEVKLTSEAWCTERSLLQEGSGPE